VGKQHPCRDAGVGEIAPGFAMLARAKRASHIDPPAPSYAIMRRACPYISRSKLKRAQVHLVLAAPPLVLQSAECWLLGLIVYELIINAVRHAFHGRNGEIRVELLRAGGFVHCKVMDNGSAPAHVQRGHGLKRLSMDDLSRGLEPQGRRQF
jgi:anti-sigma regulatory factor (Ser/Thr protein kinase)